MFSELFDKVEAAVDAHPKLVRKPSWEAKMVIDRDGCTCRIRVKLEGSRRRPMEIGENGGTPERAAEKLVRSLDYWAQSL